jgi:CRP/FNR family transcriptional regulator
VKDSSLAQCQAELRSMPIFASLDPPALQALAQRTRPFGFQPGELLFQEGEACGGLYLLTAGTVRIFKLSASGRELTLHLEQAPATVAEVPLFDGGAYPASVSAVGAVEARFLPRQDFIAVCREHPQVALAALAVFGRRLRTLVTLLEAVTFGGVRQRLARHLVEHAANDFWSGTHQELALSLGTVREVVSRNLSRFQADGLVRIRHRGLDILNRAGLEREAEAEI